MVLSRRGFLGVGVGAVAAGAVGVWRAAGDVPRQFAGETVIDGWTRISGSWDLAGLTVPAGAVLEFDPGTDVTVRSSGNVVVDGTLRMRPDTAQQTHRLQFVGVVESQMAGGGMAPVKSDVGLWVTGTLDAQGTPRAGWNRTGTDPSWLPGDEILTAPFRAQDFTTFAPYAGTVGSFRGLSTEVFNLTRNVIIGGTAQGRSHVIFLMAGQQTVRHVRFEHVGPRKPDPDNVGRSLPALGRYGLHFHHCGDASRGSLVEGCVVAHSGSRGFVPHASHGVTFRDCVAYDTASTSYWWDPDKNNDPDTGYGNHSDGVLYERCAAFNVGPKVKADKGSDQFRLAGFLLGQGTGNAAVGCVVAGVENNGAQQTSGFYWDENANPFPNVWRFEDCVAHNNEREGFFVWQNDPRGETVHSPTGLTAWLNGEGGLVHGAYINEYHYSNATLVGNGKKSTATKTYPEAAGLVIHAGITDTYTDLTIDAAGLADSCINVQNHQAGAIATSKPVVVRDAHLDGWVLAPIVYDAGKPTGKGGWVDFVNVTVGPTSRALAPLDFLIRAMPNAERVRVQNGTTAWQLRPDGSKLPIPTFA